jgi:hypothetical protein
MDKGKINITEILAYVLKKNKEVYMIEHIDLLLYENNRPNIKLIVSLYEYLKRIEEDYGMVNKV